VQIVVSAFACERMRMQVSFLFMLQAGLPAKTANPTESEPPPVNGVWVANDISSTNPSEGVQVFHVPAGSRYRVVVLDSGVELRRASEQYVQRACDEASWHPTGSFDRGTRINETAAFTCNFGREEADALLEMFNVEPTTASLMRDIFNVTQPCAHREQRRITRLGGKWWRQLLFDLHPYFRDVRAFVLAIHEALEPDIYHADGDEMLPRAPGSDVVTVVSYFTPTVAHDARWDDGWGGHLIISPFVMDDLRYQKELVQEASREQPALRIAPRPGRTVIFSGSLLHRSSPAAEAHPLIETLPALEAARLWSGGELHKVPHRARWRFSSVMQITCHNGAYRGPFRPDNRVNTLGRVLVAIAVLAYGFWQGPCARRAAPAGADQLQDGGSGMAHRQPQKEVSSRRKKNKKQHGS